MYRNTSHSYYSPANNVGFDNTHILQRSTHLLNEFFIHGSMHRDFVPEATFTVFCTPDDGRDRCQKHVE